PQGTKIEVPPTRVPEKWIVTGDPEHGTVTVTHTADAEPRTSVDISVIVTYADA
ncbi:Rib/alpha-like domain-containing protein, partial [Staphylococcus felis]|uniref:Rib/alpha-like domain-containing protein n=1 Tax=Staphylococcus felis TaxID=46127 RepID=UPI00237B200F